MDVVIVGGGIGGLSAALFLQAQGIKARIIETVDTIRELGVGINIQPHAIRELGEIGLQEAIVQAGNPCRSWGMFNRWGQLIWREPRGLDAGHDWPQVSIHRGRLQRILFEAVTERCGAASLQTGARVTGIHPDDGGATVEVQHRATGAVEQVHADVLIGADGIHSIVRSHFYPREGDPVYGGQVLWRGVTRHEPYLGGTEMIFAGYAEQKLIAYPITSPDSGGMCLINWVAEVAAEKMTRREDWNREGNLDEFLPLYADWHFPWLDVPDLIRDAEAVYEFPMVDRDPLPQWSFGRVTLLGDAAHPMYPIGANGASQAIRDGAALAQALADSEHPSEALLQYDEVRRPVTNEIVLQNRQLGPEQAMQIAHERAPEGFDDIEDVISRDELESISARYHAVTWATKGTSS